jgi:ferredoxin-type protein NapF
MSASSVLSRRNFLRGHFAPLPGPIRPPWSTGASVAEYCQPCGKCIESCPQNIISAGEDGLPLMSFAQGECTFCGACANACPQPVFQARSEMPWRLRPVIAPGCLATEKVWCRSCGDACPEAAIAFRVLLGGAAEIRIDNDLCTGCGACEAVCPRGVVSIVPSVDEAAHG